MTVRIAGTPEKRERLIQKWLAIGIADCARMTDKQLEELNGDWLYDENGLPK